MSRIPNMVLIFLTRADVETNLARNPMNFGHFDMSRCRLYVDGRFIPYKCGFCVFWSDMQICSLITVPYLQFSNDLSEVRFDVDQPTETLSALHWFDGFRQAAGTTVGVDYPTYCNGVSLMCIPL